MKLIDTHSHIDLEVFADDFDQVLGRARKNGVVAQVIPGVCRIGWGRILGLCGMEDDLFPAIGLHPLYLADHTHADLLELQKYALAGELVAIGEIGLDYFVQDVDKVAQQDLFESQLDIASEAGLPVLLHVRKAHDLVQKTLRRLRFAYGGIVHAFSGSLQQAERYLQLGFLIGVCGTISYDRATRIRTVATRLPLQSLVLETDSPDLPPLAYHNQRNSPEYLPEVLIALAQLRRESTEEIAVETTRNSRKLLGILEE